MPERSVRTTGRMGAHRRAVEQIKESYAAIPDDAAPRLAKATTNLFRFRDGGKAAKLSARDLDQVIEVDPVTRTAEVQGMTTYEHLVDATLPHGLMPYVVPQLKTITLGGAVTGLGIESTSFRDGLPHESVEELEILTGDGRIIVARDDNEHRDLFRAFPNSYGTLGYALRIRIKLKPVSPYVRLTHLPFSDADKCMLAMQEICERGEHDGEKIDFVDGVFFRPGEMYITVGQFADRAPYASDYTGMRIYYQSIRTRTRDWLTIRDYLWRWDTDWFWCSRAFGVQQPLVRSLMPRRWMRSDVYRRLVGLDRKYGVTARIDRWRDRPVQESVIQDIEVPVERGAEFLDFFSAKVGMTPVWMCPLKAREEWPLYPLEPGRLYVNFGFWGTVPLPRGQFDGYYNRMIERAVHDLDGHKSLYSTSFYPREEFWRLYNGDAYWPVKRSYDPGGRLLDLYDKCVRGR
ncbi:FAD/FMN-containing dehydrogenase [Thermocatellispora tengchongensis]|uniref:Delta(24)-sterol reductase n=1 Tax=Thermocatellispora tengchongensis TaxID=1073253 RepID=A0A840PD86_9ACTN|nr:FAD-binding oxidoreductase [Thermocatellispora tengchongensis]MBB5135127.1 FAD/FMN-containing dehydrogenase [Thermocatellispora tengchongensis]